MGEGIGLPPLSPGQVTGPSMLKAVITTALLSTSAAFASEMPQCDSPRMQKVAGGLYVKALRARDPRNTLGLGGLQAVLSDVHLVNSSSEASSCTATISFSVMRNKLSDNIGSHYSPYSLRARDAQMLKSGLYEFIHVQIYDFIHRRNAFSYQVRRSNQEGIVDVTGDLFVSALQ